MKGELRALTGARGIAAWWVVLYHLRLSMPWLPAGITAVLAKGYLAVDFFFLLSGFVMWLSWGERLRAPRAAPGLSRRRAILGFWWKRIARVWPLHAAMLGYAAALATVLAVSGHANPAAFPPAAWPLHLLLVQDWGLVDPLTWNDPAWSISAEAAAYLLFPLLVAAVDWRRVPGWMLLAAMAALLGGLHLAFAGAGAVSLGFDIRHFGILRCCCEFAAGTALCALWQRRVNAPAWPALLIAGACAVAAVAGLPETLTAPPAFAALLLALARSSGSARHPLEARALPYLGEISYATYLGHFPLFFTVKLALVSDPHDIPLAIVGLYLLLVLAVSAALYELVERPGQRWLLSIAARSFRHPGSDLGSTGVQGTISPGGGRSPTTMNPGSNPG